MATLTEEATDAVVDVHEGGEHHDGEHSGDVHHSDTGGHSHGGEGYDMW